MIEKPFEIIEVIEFAEYTEAQEYYDEMCDIRDQIKQDLEERPECIINPHGELSLDLQDTLKEVNREIVQARRILIEAKRIVCN